MTTHQTQDIIQQYYDTFAKQDLAGFLGLLTEDVTHDINQGPTEVGKPLFEKFMTNYFSAGKESVQDLIILTSPDGKYASTHFISAGKYLKDCPGCPPATGQAWELPIVSFFELRDNKISRVTVHYNIQKWLKQVA